MDRWRTIGALALAVALSGSARGQADEEKKDPPAEPPAGEQPSEQERLSEIERQIAILTEELEKLRLGQVAEEKPAAEKYGFAPAASKVYGLTRGVSIGGYGEAVFQGVNQERDDGSPSGRANEFDFLRAIVYLGYKWSDRILFNSELEFEHASTGKGGEVSVEFAYVDFFLRPEVNFRGGMVLIPVGILNELHEPPVFHGARRPQTETVIIPTTWRENGGGVFGSVGPLSYRSYLVAGLSSSGFSAASGIRGGRQSGARSRAEDFAWTGRADFTGLPGLLVGGSFFTGDSGQGGRSPKGATIEGQLNLFDLHARYNYRGLELRGLYARQTLGDAALINQSLSLSGSRSVGSRLHGGYAELAYDVLTLAGKGSSRSLIPFVRYERFDTQAEVPSGFARDPANDQTLFTVGFDFKPHPSVVLKLEYQDFHNEAGTGTNQWNFAIGYLF